MLSVDNKKDVGVTVLTDSVIVVKNNECFN